MINYPEKRNKMEKKAEKNKKPYQIDEYKLIISELGISPFRVIKVAFALTGIIPLLVILYVIIGKYFLYDVLLGSNGLITAIAIYISLMGFLLSYNLVSNMIKRLLIYSAERKKSDEEKTELLLAVTHDIKTPLTVIKTGLQNLLDGVGGVLTRMQYDMGNSCLNAVNRVQTFVQELLDISKIKFTRLNFKRELIAFEDIIKEEMNIISELAKKNNQDVKCKILSADSRVWADKEKMSRAVMNILSNALKYTPVGGRIDIVLSSDEDTVRLAVINTGPGIPPEALDRIFKRFERLDGTGKIEGTGIGLSIVKDIVELHRGHITVKSEPGQTTEFDIVLPRDLRKRPMSR